jgi:GNAT superfamily N-acetyltransferase
MPDSDTHGVPSVPVAALPATCSQPPIVARTADGCVVKTDTSPASQVRVRPAGLEDVALLARHRAEMFREMGVLDAALYARLVDAARDYFTRALPTGEYYGWLATPLSSAATVVAGAGVQVRELMPRPDAPGTALIAGPQALVVNVYTEPSWRRRGLAELLMRHILGWARDRAIGSVVLHASADGRRLYEKLGFVATNEMRHQG